VSGPCPRPAYNPVSLDTPHPFFSKKTGAYSRSSSVFLNAALSFMCCFSKKYMKSSMNIAARSSMK